MTLLDARHALSCIAAGDGERKAGPRNQSCLICQPGQKIRAGCLMVARPVARHQMPRGHLSYFITQAGKALRSTNARAPFNW